MKNGSLYRALRRGARSLAAVLLGAAGAWLVSPEFAEIVGDTPYAAIVALLVPPAALALDKLRRDLKG